MTTSEVDQFKTRHADKFAPEGRIFIHIRRGDRIFVGTGCGEPQHLVRALTDDVRSNPKALFGAEILHVWSLGVAPYIDEHLQANVRHNSFFMGNPTRAAANRGLADYTPIFLSQVPDLFHQRHIDIDVPLIQTSLPDRHGYVNLGISVDIVKAAVTCASLVVAQVNRHMPRVPGDGFLHVDEIDYLVHHDQPLIKDFFYSLSARSMYRRFLTPTWDMSHERVQDFVVVDYTNELMLRVFEKVVCAAERTSADESWVLRLRS